MKFKTSKVLSISFAHLLHDVYSSFLAPILPMLITKLEFSYFMAGMLSLIRSIPTLFNPLIGIIADRSGVRYFIILTPLITAVAMSLLGVAPSYAVLAILMFILGISSSFFHVPAPVLIRNVSGNRIGTGMSFYMLGGELARTLGPVVILGAVSIWGLEGTWKLIPFALAATIYLFFILSDVEVKNISKKKEKEGNAWMTFRKYLPLFTAITGITLFRAMMKSALTAYMPTYFNLEGGESLWFSGMTLVILQLAGAAGTLASGIISDKIGRITMLKIAVFLSPLFMYFFVHSDGIMIFMMLIMLGISLFATTPVILALLQELGSDRPAFVNGIYMTIGFGISSVAVLFIGYLGDIIGLEKTFEITSYLGLFAIPFVFFLQKIKK